jgi:GT2 family glycosyltransferase
MSVKVSIIIVSYNCRAYLEACLQHLQRYIDDQRDEVIVVDNASTDGTVAALRAQFGWVQWIEAGENLGFGRANNLGMTHAKGTHFFLLNPDTELRADAMAAGLAFFDLPAHRHVGVAGFPLLGSTGAPEVSAGNFPGLLSLALGLLPARVFPYRLKSKVRDAYTEVDYVSGADLFLPRSTYDLLGGFDPAFFLFYEETEWQHRMQRAGLKRVLLPAPHILHHVGTSDHKVSLLKITIFERSRIYYYRCVFGRFGAWYCRFMLSIFYFSRSFSRQKSYFREAVRTVWHV